MEIIEQDIQIEITKDKMEAMLNQNNKNDNQINMEDIEFILNKYGIKYGIKRDKITQFLLGEIEPPFVIAEGTQANLGKDAYIKPLISSKRITGKNIDKTETVDLRNVLEIGSVSAGTVVGIKIDVEKEIDGMNVLGEVVRAKKARDITLRPGKNTVVSEDGRQIISTIDGQVSVEKKRINVFPIYEVNGDVDLAVGNIDFIGNVTIRGGVRSGFKVIATGDIRILGSVESAEIISEGSVFITQGIVAQSKGSIKAKGNVETSFINQGVLEVGGDVVVHQSILHSTINCEGFIYCNKGYGNIVGGDISASKGIKVNEVGNSMNTPTSIYIGTNQRLLKLEKEYTTELQSLNTELEKLFLLLEKVTAMEQAGALDQKQRMMKLKIRYTIENNERKIEDLKEKIEDLHDNVHDQQDAYINVSREIHPNTILYFGKYQRKIITKHQNVQFKLERGEIKFQPYVDK
ncbi:DUF342 domain-containing protein [Evansella sp. AB-rgal1]|uniref:DUF342 domain-containing protein n=1 Tax=Evansella sp. AB-rgal1 TaxID=3242696 RepID=UPI00359D4E12